MVRHEFPVRVGTSLHGKPFLDRFLSLSALPSPLAPLPIDTEDGFNDVRRDQTLPGMALQVSSQIALHLVTNGAHHFRVVRPFSTITPTRCGPLRGGGDVGQPCLLGGWLWGWVRVSFLGGWLKFLLFFFWLLFWVALKMRQV